MARKSHALLKAGLAVLLATPVALLAQEPAAHKPPPTTEPRPVFPSGDRSERGERGERGDRNDRGPGGPSHGGRKTPPPPGAPEPGTPEFEKAKAALEKLPPEEREKLRENLRNWAKMSPEEREAMRGRMDWMKRRVQEEVDRALEEAGLKLSEERKKEFARLYFEGRRAIEEKLRREFEEKRAPLVSELKERLKKEFLTAPVTSPAPPVEPTPAPPSQNTETKPQ